MAGAHSPRLWQGGHSPLARRLARDEAIHSGEPPVAMRGAAAHRCRCCCCFAGSARSRNVARARRKNTARETRARRGPGMEWAQRADRKKKKKKKKRKVPCRRERTVERRGREQSTYRSSQGSRTTPVEAARQARTRGCRPPHERDSACCPGSVSTIALGAVVAALNSRGPRNTRCSERIEWMARYRVATEGIDVHANVARIQSNAQSAVSARSAF